MTKRLHAAALFWMMLTGCGGGQEKAMPGFMLTSPAFADGQRIPANFSCDGEDRSPPLSWSGPPAGTRSFALVVDDPDAPNGTFRHWGTWNIPADADRLEEGQGDTLPQAVNDFGRTGYGGACPPRGHGPHRYRFKLFALDTKELDLPAGSSVEAVEAAAAKHQLARAELTGTYERK